MKAWLLITAVAFGVLGAGMYFFVLPQAAEQRAVVKTQGLTALYEREASACMELAQRIYVRDFAIICARSHTASSTPCKSDLNAAVAYGVFQQQENPTGDLANLYAAYLSDVDSCIKK